MKKLLYLVLLLPSITYSMVSLSDNDYKNLTYDGYLELLSPDIDSSDDEDLYDPRRVEIILSYLVDKPLKKPIKKTTARNESKEKVTDLSSETSVGKKRKKEEVSASELLKKARNKDKEKVVGLPLPLEEALVRKKRNREEVSALDLTQQVLGNDQPIDFNHLNTLSAPHQQIRISGNDPDRLFAEIEQLEAELAQCDILEKKVQLEKRIVALQQEHLQQLHKTNEIIKSLLLSLLHE